VIEDAVSRPYHASARLIDQSIASWRQIAQITTETTLGYWRQALTSPGLTSPIEHYGRWLQLTTTRRLPGWHTPNDEVFTDRVATLRDFSTEGATQAVPTLLLPPQAGHHSCIVDFTPNQSQVSVALESGLDRLYVLEWLAATTKTSDVSITDVIHTMDRAIAEIGGPVHLVGDCQGGWLAALYAGLRPDSVASLTVAGAPIDFHAGEGPLTDFVTLANTTTSLGTYRAAVQAGGGILRGELMIGGFIALKPELELRKHLELLLHLDDPAFTQRYTHFEDWYKHPQAISGALYLWIVEHLFIENALISGRLLVGDAAVDLAQITCPVTMIGGATDHITPPEQVFALGDHIATPEDQQWKITADSGHLGLFMSHSALETHWRPTFRRLAGLRAA
jgi:poly(3-hydroxyalkanoate) synthetase